MSEKPSAVLDPTQATFLEIAPTVFCSYCFLGNSDTEYIIPKSKQHHQQQQKKHYFFNIYKNKKHKKVFWFIKVKLSYITALSPEHCAEK